MGNPDLNFKIRICDFTIDREVRPHGGFQLRNSNPDFMDSFLLFDWEIRKRICKTILVNTGLLFANYAPACACKTTGLKNCLSNPFSDFPKKRKERESKNRYLSFEIRFQISRSIANSKFKT